MIKFSVIIPTYNRANDLRRCLDSLVLQTYQNFEVLVCDDGSTDNTKEVVEAYQGRLSIAYYWEENWGGPAHPRNIGIKHAKAEWICFLDSDDWWYPKKLEECVKFLNSADIIYHDLDVYVDAHKKPVKSSHTRQIKSNAFNDLLVNGNALSNSSVVVRKSTLERVGGISENKELISVEDWDCWLRIAKVTDRFTYLPLVLGGYLVGQNISRSMNHAASLETLALIHISSVDSEVDKSIVKKRLYYSLARVYHINGNYRQALCLYIKSGLSVLIKRMLKFWYFL